jgi:uncharacterized membrane protein YkoI
MRRHAAVFFILLLSAILLGQAEVAWAAPKEAAPDKVAEPIIPMSTVLQNLKMNGYEIVSKVDLDSDVFNIDALTPQGKELSITMNAHSGEITSPKENPAPRLSLVEAVKRVEGSGYHDISKVEYSGGKYIVKARDEKDKKVKLKVDGDTGDIAKAWF